MSVMLQCGQERVGEKNPLFKTVGNIALAGFERL